MAAVTAPDVIVGVFVLALGCAVGSFLNVIIWRLPRGLTINDPPRSICPQCGASIRFSDNVPLLSFLVLKGKCRACGGAISWGYPAVEGVTGVLFALIFFVQRASPLVDPGQAVVMALFASLLVAASAVDMQFFIIPDEISFFGLAGGVLAGLLVPGLHVGEQPYHTFASLTGLHHLDGLLGSVIGALGGGLLVLVFAVVGTLIFRREAMGMGDVKLMAMVGAFFGWKVASVAFFIAPFFGLLYGLPLLFIKRERIMPYGPFLSAGSLLTVFLRVPLCGKLGYYIATVRAIFSQAS